jgi:hypothetical protein
MQCKICKGLSNIIFTQSVLKKYEVKYYQCSKCYFIQTEEPYWLGEAYENPINIEDTGIIERNNLLSKRTASILFFFFDYNGIFVDYAAGYGIFVRLMRDLGFDYYWTDIYTENIFARGFEYNSQNPNKIEAVTAFECFEHFSEPLQEIEKIFQISENIIFSTEVFNQTAPPLSWEYYSFSHGQHVSFYSIQSLEYLAKKLNVNFYSNGKSFHMFSKKKINPTSFNLLLKASLTGLPIFIKKKLGSKTLEDSIMMSKTR